MGPFRSGRAATHRGGMARKLQAADRFQLVALETQNGDIAVEEISNVEEFSIGAERRPLGEAADFRFGHLPYLLLRGVDLEQRHVGMRMIEELVMRQV